MITVDDYLTTCGKYPERLVFVDDVIRANAALLVPKVNALFALYGQSRKLTSGFRDPTSNAACGGAKYSWHMRGLAADIDDHNGFLGDWILHHEDALVECGLYAEDPRRTSIWLHVQTEPPRSKQRIFKP